MEIHESRVGDILVLAPDGSIAGSEETSAIETRLGTALKTGFQLLVVDCTSVGQLTSAAIRVLLMTSRKLGRTEGRLVLYGMSGKVQKAFSISGFDKDFSVVATREEALRHVLEPVQPRPSKAPKERLPKRPVVKEAVAPLALEAPPVTPAVAVAPDSAAPELDGHEALVAAILDTLGRPRLPVATAARPVRVNLEDVAVGILAALRAGGA